MSLINKFRPTSVRPPQQMATARPQQKSAHGLPLHAPTAGPGTPKESVGRFSNGLKEFLWHLDGIGHGNLLDMGPVSQATVSYFIERGFKVYTEDVLSGWRAFLREQEDQARTAVPGTVPPDSSPAARAERFLSANLGHAPDTFDAVLLWDVLDYLDRDMVPSFLSRLSTLVREAGAIFAVFHTRMPEQFHRYRVIDAHNLELVPATPLVQPRHVYQNREIQELFERYRTSKSFVSRDQLRESVFVK